MFDIHILIVLETLNPVITDNFIHHSPYRYTQKTHGLSIIYI